MSSSLPAEHPPSPRAHLVHRHHVPVIVEAHAGQVHLGEEVPEAEGVASQAGRLVRVRQLKGERSEAGRRAGLQASVRRQAHDEGVGDEMAVVLVRPGELPG